MHLVLVHMIAEAERHAGQADIVRESIDGAAGVRRDQSNLPDETAAWWASYVAQVEAAASEAAVIDSADTSQPPQ